MSPVWLLTVIAIHANLVAISMFLSVAIMSHEVVHTKLGEGRRVAIPADLCHQYGLEPGDPVVLESSDAGIIVRPLDVVIREVQAFFKDAAPADVAVSEELIRDRREEAAREDSD